MIAASPFIGRKAVPAQASRGDRRGKGAAAAQDTARETTPAAATRCFRSGSFDIVGPLADVGTPQQFLAWTESEFQRVFPHHMLVCGIGRIETQGVRVLRFLTRNFPEKYIESLRQKDNSIISPLIGRWLKSQRPVLFDTAKQDDGSPWLKNFRRYGLHNVAAHGLCDIESRTASYFSFSRIPGKLTSRHAELLEALVPPLHATLIRVLGVAQMEFSSPAQAGLTPREVEILRLLREGKNNGEIAQALSISRATVRNHVHHILVRLDAGNRAHAVAKAMNLGLLR